jgi:hypothetical protein
MVGMEPLNPYWSMDRLTVISLATMVLCAALAIGAFLSMTP